MAYSWEVMEDYRQEVADEWIEEDERRRLEEIEDGIALDELFEWMAKQEAALSPEERAERAEWGDLLT